jgi:MFS family permease
LFFLTSHFFNWHGTPYNHLVFGALIAQYVTVKYGRRKTFLSSAIIFIIGVVLMSISGTYSLLMFGRFLVGIGVGVGLAVREHIYFLFKSLAFCLMKFACFSSGFNFYS